MAGNIIAGKGSETMGYFPMCIDLTGKTVLLVGNGRQIQDKMEKLRPFGCRIQRLSTICKGDLEHAALVVVGDTGREEAARVSGLCASRGIPVNVVDEPELSSFFFPAMITRGDLTVSVSTGGRTPGAAGYLAKQIDARLPDRTEEILDWLARLRGTLYARYPKETAREMLSRITRQAFREGRPLTEAECSI